MPARIEVLSTSDLTQPRPANFRTSVRLLYRADWSGKRDVMLKLDDHRLAIRRDVMAGEHFIDGAPGLSLYSHLPVGTTAMTLSLEVNGRDLWHAPWHVRKDSEEEC